MVGLVVASASSALRRVAEKFNPSTMPQPVTLSEELAARGIETYPLERVREYQNAFLMGEKKAGRAGELAAWQNYSASTFFGFFTNDPPPTDVKRTIRRAQTIPDSRVVIERFYEDPFVFLHRDKEICCIGYWNAPGFQP